MRAKNKTSVKRTEEREEQRPDRRSSHSFAAAQMWMDSNGDVANSETTNLNTFTGNVRGKQYAL